MAGDDSNKNPAYKDRLIPTSYAYNGGYFHEAKPDNAPQQRPREQAEIKNPAGLILVLESRAGHPDLGFWCINECARIDGKLGSFQTHQGRLNWLFADTHAKSLKLIDTISPKQMWDEINDGAAELAFQKDLLNRYKTAITSYPEYR